MTRPTKPKRAAPPAKVQAQAQQKAAGEAPTPTSKRILSVDIGGSHVKFKLNTGDEVRRFDSGPALAPAQMCAQILDMTKDWTFEAVSLGYPGPVLHGKPVHDPANLAPGWVGFDFATTLGKPVKLVNDAAMQALGSYQAGKMLFLGLGTGLGSAMVVQGIVEPLELAHLPYRKHTYEDYVGLRGMKKYGKKQWRKQVAEVVTLLRAALLPDEVVLGGGQTQYLKEPPEGTRLGDNANAFIGGFRLWDDEVNARALE